jgi:CheY-like chemotaxis protein
MGDLFNLRRAGANRPNNPSEPMGALRAPESGDQGPQAMDANIDETFDFEVVEPEAPCAEQESSPALAVHVPKSGRQFERRRRRRAIISAPVRVRSADVTCGPDEILTTTNVSRTGILFHTSNQTYRRGMKLAVTFPYSASFGNVQAERPGRVARINNLADGLQAIAVEFCDALAENLADDRGHDAATEAVPAPSAEELAKLYPEIDAKKPLVLVVDACKALRETLKTYLSAESYEVIAVATNGEARDTLKIMMPALIIAEVEGENMPGYDLCVHVKSTQHLKRIPVMLMTSSAYPSDYASAHSLGAVVCIAKPFRQERFGHVVRMLAPPPEGREKCAPARPADPTRRHVAASSVKSAHAKSLLVKRFQMGRGK